jgi:hypothetical protein
MQFPNLTAGLGRLVSENATTLLTAGGVVGTIGAAAISFRAGMRSKDRLIEAISEHEKKATEYVVESDGMGQYPEFDKKAHVKAIWPELVPPVLVCGATIASIVMSNRVSAKQAAVLAAGYGLAQNQLEEYKAKVLESVGVKKEEKIRDALAQDSVDKDPPKGQVLMLGEGEVLFKDSLTGRYFKSTVDKVRKAENAVNAQLFHYQICSLSFFYDELDQPGTELSDGIGWNMSTSDDRQVKLELSTTLTPDEKPCIVIGFNVLPKHNYEQLY